MCLLSLPHGAGRQPCKRTVLLNVCVLCFELSSCRLVSGLCDPDVFQQVIYRYADSEVRVAFLQLVDVVPFCLIVYHVEERQELRLFRFSEEHTCCSCEQLVIYSIVDISGCRDGYHERLFPLAGSALQCLIELQSLVSCPCCELIAEDEGYVKSVRSLRIVCERLCGGVVHLDVYIAPSLQLQLVKFRFLDYRLIEGLVCKSSLFELRSSEVYPLAVAFIHVQGIQCEHRSEERLSVPSSHRDHYLLELPASVLIYQSEDGGH